MTTDHRTEDDRPLSRWEILIQNVPDELLDYVVNDEDDGDPPLISHPLVVLFFHTREELSHMLAAKERAIEQARAANDWLTVIGIHERPYRLDAVHDHALEMDDESYWQALAFAWTDTEFPRQRLEDWTAAFSENRPERETMMDAEELEIFRSLQGPITIYRGISDEAATRGLSWTLSRDVAERFARRFADAEEPALMATATIDAENVIAYFVGRQEQEVIVWPGEIRDIDVVALP